MTVVDRVRFASPSRSRPPTLPPSGDLTLITLRTRMQNQDDQRTTTGQPLHPFDELAIQDPSVR